MHEAEQRGIVGLVEDAADGDAIIVGEHDTTPTAAVISYDQYESWQQAREQQRLYVVTMTRLLERDRDTYTFDEVLTKFGLDEGDLVSPPADFEQYQK